MAVQPWELDDRPAPQPLRLAAPPPRPSGHPFAAAALVVALVVALGLPVVRSSARHPDAGVARSRLLPVTELAALDPIAGLPAPARPQSREPVGGVAYVSCTRLWIAHPDGTHGRKVLEMDGISSPAFAPTGRSIAFLRTTREGQEIWVTAADGSSYRPLGRLTGDGDALDATATGLAWSPDGHELAFALVDGRNDPWVDGSSLWTLDLRSGEFSTAGSGFPTPLWIRNKLVYPTYLEGRQGIRGAGYNRWVGSERGSERALAHMGAAAISPHFFYAGGPYAVVVREGSDGDVEIAVKHQWKRRTLAAFGPPVGHDIDALTQPTIAQDGTRAFVDLVDRAGERDLGIVDLRSGDWDVVDYAWEPAASPVPAATRGLDRARATGLIESLLARLNRPVHLGLYGLDRSSLPIRPGEGSHMGFLYSEPIGSEGRWRTKATMLRWDRETKMSSYLQFDLSLEVKRGDVVADVRAASGWEIVDTIGEAFTFAERALGRELPIPELPAGTRLEPMGSATGWSWGGSTTVQVNFRTPGAAKYQSLVVSYGDEIGFNLGCGGEMDPDPIDIGGPDAMHDRMAPTNQIIWPASPGHTSSATYSVHGPLSKEEIAAIARSMIE